MTHNLLDYESTPKPPPAARRLRWLSNAHFIVAFLLAIELPSITVVMYSIYNWGSRASISVPGYLEMARNVLTEPAIVAYLALAAMTVGSGWLTARRRWRYASMLVGIFLLFAVPLGTLLGLATLILLMRRESIDLYRAAGAAGLDD
jgi:ABC-type sugar transport system permease subunit